MKPDLQIYFDAKKIEALVGRIEEIPEILDINTEIAAPINKEPNLLSFFYFKRSKSRPIRLSEHTIHAYRSLFYSKYGDCRELFEWVALITAGEDVRREYKIHESEIFYNHALEVAQRFLPSNVVAHSLLSVYWSHFLFAWCKQDQSNIDKALISGERLIGFLEKISANHLKNESINGLHFYVDPRIEMLKYLDRHAVEPANNEEKNLEILKGVLNKNLERGNNHNHPISPQAPAIEKSNYRSSLKEPESVLSYRCRMYLPKDIEYNHFVPEPSYAPRNNTEVDLLSGADPQGVLYDMLRQHCYPDPPNFHIARFKDWFRIVDPELFQEGAIKETIKERLSYFIKDRNRIIKSYCKENHVDLSVFPPLTFTKVQEPKFRHFGPKNTWIDKVDRWLRQIDFYVAFFIRGIIITISLEVLLVLNFLLAASLRTQLIFLLVAITIFILIEIPVRHFSYKSALRRAKSEPIIRPAEIDLNILLSELKDWGQSLISQIPDVLHIPDLSNIKTSIQRSRPHPDKKAYSISIVSDVLIKPKRFSTFVRPEKLTLNIEIVGQSKNGPHIFVFWFDPPKSILLAKQSLRIISYVRDEIYRLMLCRLDSHEKFICLPGDKKSFRYYDDRVLVQYWPADYPQMGRRKSCFR